MVTLTHHGVYLHNGREIVPEGTPLPPAARDAAAGTMAAAILAAHDQGGAGDTLRLKFDALTSHDITYVSIVQTAKASGLERFPVPYILTNCHNSLCAVGGTINEDDHRFGLSAAIKYGGEYVPPHIAVIHQYMRERYAGCGKMILGSDSHTRYGALGTMAIGEGGGELVKQLLGKTYDVKRPEVVCIYLTGAPQPGVGPQDVALAIIGATFQNGFVKNKVMEFVGPGVANLSQDFRNGVDVMTTETSCLSSIWVTDEKTREFLAIHGREQEYAPLAPAEWAWYDALVEVDLSAVRPMIALPFHPSNTYAIEDFLKSGGDILREIERSAPALLGRPISLTDKFVDGRLHVDQAVIAGCAGGSYENILSAAAIIGDTPLGCGEEALSVYPASQSVMLGLLEEGAITRLTKAGATIRTAFCGPCFGAGDVPFNGALSIRHTTRNFPYREGARPADAQTACVALMDARSIAATAKNGGVLTPATDCMPDFVMPPYRYDASAYKSRVYCGCGCPKAEEALAYGPNIVDWPEIPALAENLLLKVTAFITDPVTTTDELIPSGETSSYRSNPLRLAEFTLSRKVPGYVAAAKEVQGWERARQAGEDLSTPPALQAALDAVHTIPGQEQTAPRDLGIASVIYAVKPGDGSAREQAASCQRVLGGGANICREYATKRYRSNLINWGMLPFTMEAAPCFGDGDFLYLPGIRAAVAAGAESVTAYRLDGGKAEAFTLSLGALTDDERRILLAGCLINDYRN